MTRTNSVLVNTANSTQQLGQLFHSGSPDGAFCIPFVDVSSKWRFMKSDASRSIIQTNIKKWMDGTVSGSDPTSILTISKENDAYRVSATESYPSGLGSSKKLFAPTTTSSASIPLLSMAVWVFAKEDIPDSDTAEDYLRQKLRDYLHLDQDEENQIFSSGNQTLTFTDKPISDPALFALCNGHAITGSANCMQYRFLSRQLITYGAPGTGKSFMVDGLTDNPDVAACVRTTFHPDSDYATFVGAYKPTMNAGSIVYSFRPQAFMNAYVRAWQEMANPDEGGEVKNVVLVIEEINRGNCAQIFCDLFQLLDRGNGGYSTYPIDADADLAVWLEGRLAEVGGAAGVHALPGLTASSLASSVPVGVKAVDWQDVLAGKKLMLPPNLYIWATMNTSDQSLFPIDSAFKRRWDWKYIPISKPDKSDDPNWKDRKIIVNGKSYDWWKFIQIINAHIAKTTKSEDKQLGYFFVKAPDDTGVITAERFANKVLFYLFNDVFKDWDLPVAIFGRGGNSNAKFAFKEFFFDASDENHKTGDVKEDVVAEFIERQEYNGDKVSAEE